MCFSLWLLSSKSSSITRSFHRILYETISWHTWASRLHKRKIPKNQYPFEKKMMLSLTPCGIWQPGIHTNLIRLLKVKDSFLHLTFFHKVHIFWEGHKILRNFHLTFDWHYIGQIIDGDFTKFCGLLRIYELYKCR